MADNEYVNISPEDFSETVQELVAVERQMYQAMKAHKAKVLAAVQAEVAGLPMTREIKSTTYTRWGQWQLVIGDRAIAKPQANGRQSLAEFLATQAQSGRAV
jgi:hypothetical protein